MLRRTGGLPDAVVACVGGGSNAIGLFHPFLADRERRAPRHRGRRPRRGSRRQCRDPRATAARACCRAATRCCCRTPTARSRRRIRSRPGSIIPASGPSTRCCRDRARALRVGAATTRRWRRVKECCEPEGILPAHRNRARARRRAALGRRASGQPHPDRAARAAVTRTCRPCTDAAAPAAGRSAVSAELPRDRISAAAARGRARAAARRHWSPS